MVGGVDSTVVEFFPHFINVLRTNRGGPRAVPCLASGSLPDRTGHRRQDSLARGPAICTISQCGDDQPGRSPVERILSRNCHLTRNHPVSWWISSH